ncbi:hypothetical protein [Chitinophaga qingshengii]|uniref:DUF4138 domain-containing protein n=1 Tax=Chitinophaga qingshengii TaxID=1569794 RepID=A0ABR7TI59_9BACT|nr:hypothetical protein [Chitinophaga qingshengii]MBC9930202.1 hypothetical protein [Chitinophaga qingshengii]
MAQQVGRTDTVLTKRGASTLITSGSPITTFQIGDGKNADYDYRIVDGNMAVVRAVSAAPKPTNLIVREGDNIHYMILTFRENADLAKLRYVLSKKPAAIAGVPENRHGDKDSGNKPQNTFRLPEEDDSAPLVGVDTVTVSDLAESFKKDSKVNHNYEVKVDGVSLGYAKAMTLSSLNYFCFHIRNKNKDPYEFVKATLIHKEKKDTAVLHTMPLLYKKGPATIDAHGEAQEVFVVPSRVFKKDDEIIIVLEPTENKPQLVLYVPASTLPKYMLTK